MLRQTILVADHNNIRYLCPLNPDKGTYTISDDISADIYIPYRGHPFRIGLHAVNAVFTETGHLQELTAIIGSSEEPIDIRQGSVTFLDDIGFHIERHHEARAEINLETENVIHVGNNENNRIVLSKCKDDIAFVLARNNDGVWMLHPFARNRDPIYINGYLCTNSQALANSDIIHVAGCIFEMKDTSCVFFCQRDCILNDLTLYVRPADETRYPEFQRPPRKLYPEPSKKIVIPNPPAPLQKDPYGLLIMIAPIPIMLLLTILVSILTGGGIYMLVMVGAMSVTAIVTAFRLLKDRKKKQDTEASRVNFYQDILFKKHEEILESISKQQRALEFTYPAPEQCIQLVQTFSPRLWERASGHTDFLSIRIGTGDQPLSFRIEYNFQGTAQDPISKDAEELAAKFTHNPGLPVRISLKDAYIGVVGPQSLTLPHTLALLTGLCVLHSYLEMTLILVGSESQELALYPFKWVPHTWLDERRFKGFVSNKTTRDKILVSVLQIIKQRQIEHESNPKTAYPPMVILIADLDLVYNHPIMEFLSQDSRYLGVYAIFLSETEYTLPESATTLLTLLNPNEAILFQKKHSIARAYVPDILTAEQTLQATRSLAPLQHIMTSADETMPETVTLFELFQVETPAELDIPNKWQSNKPYKTLSVPLGLRSANEILELNLHEKAHGPHGLLAGTTGSGKSEILQSYIISLAIHFHPHDVAFLLIDDKGGMANAFSKLPHLLGTITNLNGAQAMRMLIAIKSELQRRQTLMDHHNVNHIDIWQELCTTNSTLEPIPHLFIIFDEFAELKREQPEFIKDMVSIACTGCSLGVHLILATQKPSGIVDDQIWNNTNFKICLQVSNTDESKQILKTPDSADIKVPGRGYLQVNNNGIYELFQSAYSGLPYQSENKSTQKKHDRNIYVWNDLGQAQLLTRDFSTLHTQEESVTNFTVELDMAAQAITQAFDSMGLSKIATPWLPPLSETLFLPDLLNNPGLLPEWENDSASQKEEESSSQQGSESTSQWVIIKEDPHQQDITVTVGMLDEIEKQRQTPLTINFTSDGHIGVFGSPGSGKSTFLHTIALALSLSYTPSQAGFFILDFGNNSLLPLRDLPHTAAIMTLDNKEERVSLQDLLLQEMKRRKDILGTSRVTSINQHNRLNETKQIPAIFIFIDNIDPIREQERSDMENVIKDISQEGQALAIYLIFTASRPSVVRPFILENIQTKFMFHMIDIQDIFSILGKTELQSEKIPGRGLTGSSKEICVFQAALPVRGKTEEDRTQLFRQVAETIHSAWQGPLPLSERQKNGVIEETQNTIKTDQETN